MNNTKIKLQPTILCGGSGTRLWPSSRSEYPKQFLALLDERSFFEKTYERAKGFCISAEPLIVTLNKHIFLVRQQLKNLQGEASIICEPMSRNTCPAITAAALNVEQADEDTFMLVLPSDQFIGSEDTLKEAANAGLPLATAGKLVTFGVKPETAHTGFGYIRTGEPFLKGFCVDEFTEKPDKSLAEFYVESGKYLWNSGIFLFSAKLLLEKVSELAPEIFSHVKKAFNNSGQGDRVILLNEEDYRNCPNDSIDCAVMEKAKDIAVIPMALKWNDIGSWESLGDMVKKDQLGNSTQGDVFLKDSEKSFIRAESRMVAATGLKNMLVVETPDVVMVAPKDKSQEIRELASDLEKLGREELNRPKVVNRPWGTYESIATGENYQVKRIIVYPEQSLSLQQHKHRSEHWTVVVGTGVVDLNDSTFELSANESTYIAAGSKHRLSNKTQDILEIIEVQTGSYLGEDDIIRYEDSYGRLDNNTT